jgi:hypothetical protein
MGHDAFGGFMIIDAAGHTPRDCITAIAAGIMCFSDLFRRNEVGHAGENRHLGY